MAHGAEDEAETPSDLEPLLLRAAAAFRARDSEGLGRALGALGSALRPPATAVGLEAPPRPPGWRAELAGRLDALVAAELLARDAPAWLCPLLLRGPPLAEAAEALLEELAACRREEVLAVPLPGAEGLRIAVAASAAPDWSMADGRCVWHGARGFAKEVCRGAVAVRGQRVLELGCGLGVAGLACARGGAEAVLLSDYDEDVLRACRRSAELSGLSSVTDTLRLDWAEAVAGAPLDDRLSGFDLVIGADIVYEDRHAELVLGVLERLLVEGRAREAVLVTGEPASREGVARLDELLAGASAAELGSCARQGRRGALRWEARALPEREDGRPQRLYRFAAECAPGLWEARGPSPPELGPAVAC